MTIPESEILHLVIALVGGGLGLLMLLVGWLLRRAIDGVDTRITEALDLVHGHESRIAHLEGRFGINAARPPTPPSGVAAHRKQHP